MYGLRGNESRMDGAERKERRKEQDRNWEERAMSVRGENYEWRAKEHKKGRRPGWEVIRAKGRKV
jgi:hypothetical protein